MKAKVLFSRLAAKQYRKIPGRIADKVLGWIGLVETMGLAEARRRPGWHDEPLKGKRLGQRSIRLNRSWRAIYTTRDDGALELVRIEEISHHDY